MLPSFLAAIFALVGMALPAFARHQFDVEFDASKHTNLERGSAEFLQLGDGEIRVVGQNVERGLTPDKLHF
jgi:hypothetical protein